MPGRWGEAPFVALTGCLAFGIAASDHLCHYSFLLLVLAGGALLGAAVMALHYGRLRICLFLGLCTITLDGFLLGLADRDGYAKNDVRALIASGALSLSEPVEIDGCVLEDGSRRGPDTVSTLQLHGLRRKEAWISCRGKVQLRIRASDDLQVPGTSLECGDRVRAWADFDVPRNFQNPGSSDRAGFLARRGIYLLGRVKSARLIQTLPKDCGTPWDRAAAAVRRRLQKHLRIAGQEADPQQAAILSSIVLGDYLELGSRTRTEFQNSGTYHVLVVSGLHVSWIALVLMHMFRFLRLPSEVGRLFAACGILFYTCLVGFQASISRALWMFTLFLLGQSLFRRASPTNTVFACAFLLLCAHPAWLLEVGFQLSFLSVAAIALMALPAIERCVQPLFDPLRHAGDQHRLSVQPGRWHMRGRRLRFRIEIFVEACADRIHADLERTLMKVLRASAGIAWAAASMILVSLSVQIWLDPVLALYFNRLSWVAPAANLAVVPLSSLVLAAGMIALVLTSLTGYALPAFKIAGLASYTLLHVNRWFSNLPGAWQRCPTPSGFWVLAGILSLIFWCFLRRRHLWIPVTLVAIELSILSLTEGGILPQAEKAFVPTAGEPRLDTDQPLLRLSFLDVGQGDCTVVQFPDGRVWVVDAGGLRLDPRQPEGVSSYDIGEAVVSRFLWSRWIVRLNRVYLTHAHQDHAGGMPSLLQNFPADRLDVSKAGAEQDLAPVLTAARAVRVPVHAASAGEEYIVAGVSVKILNPSVQRPLRSVNDSSVVLRLKLGRFAALLAGDMESPAESEAMERAPDPHSLMLKVAHHGSRNATLEPFLDMVRPRWAVISAGRNNPFGNPSRETLQRLVRHGARLLLTMNQGAIFLDTDGFRYRISSHTLGVLEQGLLDSSKLP